MKSCEKYVDLMMRSIDGEISGQEETVLHVHLMNCAECKARYDCYRAIDNGIRQIQEEPPKGLTHAIMNSIHQEKHRYHPKNWIKRGKFTIVAAVAAALLLVVGKLGISYSNQSAGTVSTSTEYAVEEEAAPEVVAEFRSGDSEKIADQQAITETVPEVQEEEPVLEAPENTDVASESVTNGPEDVYSSGGTIQAGTVLDGNSESTLQGQIEEAGYAGQFFVVSGIGQTELETYFGDYEIVNITDDLAIYGVQLEMVQELIENGTLNVSKSFRIGSESNQAWLVIE